MMTMADDDPDLPEPAPAFARHFTDPAYDDVGDDLSPLGSDEGFDLVWTWAPRRAELDRTSRLATVLECEPEEVADYDGPMVGVDGVQTAGTIIGAAFTLLRLVCHLHDDDRELALRAVDHEIAMLPVINPAVQETPAVLLTLRADLAAWRNPTA